MSETKGRIIEAAAGLMAERGYRRTSIDDVIDRASLSGKSHFYHYFRSKEELAMAVVDRQFDRLAEQGGAILRDTTLGPADRLQRFVEALVMLHGAGGVEGGGAAGNLSAEIFVLGEGFRVRLALAFDRWVAQIESTLWEARAFLKPGTDTRRLSRFIVATLEGALMLSKVSRDAGMLREVETDLKRFLAMHVREGGTA